jgi:3-isopropylmalate/(R)-2-methylmalate dehydratase small subunit
MVPFTIMTAPACPLGLENVDTDQLIPARFMQTPRAQGYGGFLLHDLRRTESGSMRVDFVLNDPRYAAAAVMIARNNFGCGSSREAAVYVLADAGFRCVLAPGFGDIFTSNAIQNGLLPARVAACDIEALLNDPSVLTGAPITIDLMEQSVSCGNKTFAFDLRADFRQRLLNGWDAIDMTRSYAKDIEAFLVRDRAARPWRDPAR